MAEGDPDPSEDKMVHFSAKIVHPDGSSEWRSGSGKSSDFTEFFKQLTLEMDSKESARNARWLVDENGWRPSPIFNLWRFFHRLPRVDREYVRDFIAIELDRDGIYRVLVDAYPVLEFNQSMEILKFETGDWQHMLRMWV